MRTLVYVDGPTVPEALEEWASGQDATIEWRNGRLFSSPERRADRVITDMDEVRSAYQDRDVEVTDMPKNEATRRRYVAEKGDAGWHKVKDRQTGEYVEGASKRSAEKAQQVADKLNNG